MKKTIFKGIATALVTPIEQSGVNYEQLGNLINWQIEEGINALVICGTTGEASTLTEKEHMDVIEYAAKKINKRVPMIAGTGSNHTDFALELTKFSADMGVDGVLVVTPYYNKTTQKGLIKMFTEIADCSSAPVILYNVPSRTGMNIEPQTYRELAEHENIVAIKEANGNISKIVETMALCGDKLDMYSGNDEQIVPIMSLGGIGAISVLSNVLPRSACEICNKFFDGDVAGSAKLQLELLPLINALFCEVNPIPVKAAVAAMGYCENYLRSPLCAIEEEHKIKLLGEMRRAGIPIRNQI